MVKRNEYADCLKGVLMLSVVVSHAATAVNWHTFGHFAYIPYSMNAYNMPLFMTISGYYFYYSARKRTCSELISNKLTHILLPCIIWGTIIGCLKSVFDVHVAEEGTGMFSPLWAIWFLWSLCISFCLCIVTLCVQRHSIPISHALAAAICVGLHFLPNDVLPRNNYNIAYMFPFFYAGYLVAMYKLLDFFSIRVLAIVFLLLLAMLPILSHGYLSDLSVWKTGTYIFGNLGWERHLAINVVRIILALLGSVLFSGVFWYVCKIMKAHRQCFSPALRRIKCIILAFGEYSLGIYAIQSIIVEIIFKRLVDILWIPVNYVIVFQCVAFPLTCAVLAGLCLLSCRAISMIDPLRMALLGK